MTHRIGRPPADSARRVHALTALLLVLAWWGIVCAVRPTIVADELFHYNVAAGFAEGHAPPAGYLTVPATFHRIASWVLAATGASLPAMRGVVVAWSGLLIVAAYFAARSRDLPGEAVLLAIVCPLVLPYTALGYTDVPALAAVVAGVALHRTGRSWPAALCLLLAAALRQTSAVWLLLPAIEICRTHRNAGVAALARALLPFAAAGAVVAVGVWWQRNDLVAAQASNEVRFNRGQLFLFLLSIAVLWLPLWIAAILRDWRAAILPRLMHGVGAAALLAAIALVAALFDNPHPWNTDPAYLRNRLLVWLDVSPTARAAAATLIVVGAIGAWLFVREMNRRGEVAGLAVVSALFVAPHWLIDPRYYMIPLALLHLTLDVPRGQAWALLGWQGAIAIVGCAVVIGAAGETAVIW